MSSSLSKQKGRQLIEQSKQKFKLKLKLGNIDRNDKNIDSSEGNIGKSNKSDKYNKKTPTPTIKSLKTLITENRLKYHHQEHKKNHQLHQQHKQYESPQHFPSSKTICSTICSYKQKINNQHQKIQNSSNSKQITTSTTTNKNTIQSRNSLIVENMQSSNMQQNNFMFPSFAPSLENSMIKEENCQNNQDFDYSYDSQIKFNEKSQNYMSNINNNPQNQQILIHTTRKTIKFDYSNNKANLSDSLSTISALKQPKPFHPYQQPQNNQQSPSKLIQSLIFRPKLTLFNARHVQTEQQTSSLNTYNKTQNQISYSFIDDEDNNIFKFGTFGNNTPVNKNINNVDMNNFNINININGNKIHGNKIVCVNKDNMQNSMIKLKDINYLKIQ